MIYQVLEASSVQKINALVKEYLADGYSLQGGVSVTCNSTTGEYSYVQAVTKTVDL